MHYYPHNIGDYRRDTIHLTLLEHGAYRQLLDCYYLSETPIPAEAEAVFRKLSARTEEERAAVQDVLSEFFTLTPEGWIHTRCDKEIASYRTKANRSRENGKRGGRPFAEGKTVPEKGETGKEKKTQQVISGFSEKTQQVISGFSKKTQQVISGFSEKTQTKANALTHKRSNALTQERRNAGTQEPINAKTQCSSASGETLAQGYRLPEDWVLPTEWKQWAAQPPRSLSMEKIEHEAALFKEYWLNCKTQRGYKKDWRQTWRNWIERSLPQTQKPEKFNALAYVNGWHKEGENGNVIEHS